MAHEIVDGPNGWDLWMSLFERRPVRFRLKNRIILKRNSEEQGMLVKDILIVVTDLRADFFSRNTKRVDRWEIEGIEVGTIPAHALPEILLEADFYLRTPRIFAKFQTDSPRRGEIRFQPHYDCVSCDCPF